MKSEEYHCMYAAELQHWWHRSLWNEVRFWLEKTTEQRPQGQKTHVLDAGCGTGAVLKRLDLYTSVTAVGVDCSDLALNLARTRTSCQLVKGDTKQLPFRANVFDVVVCLDVLYTIEAFPAFHATLEQIRDVLTDRGVFILQLPAFEFMRARHDKNIHTAHRFRAAEVRKGLIDAGFTKCIVYYRCHALLAAAWLFRKLLFRHRSRSEVSTPSRFLNELAYGYAEIESRVTRHLPVPFGLSVFAVGYK
tara:strand:+ start:1474 stop:2217 length:744 start_codon:yes stop_codon:yes gene_type:complete